MARIRVTAERTYDVFIGSQWRNDLSTLMAGRTRVAIISSGQTRELIGQIPPTDAQLLQIELPDGEAAKTPETFMMIIDALGKAGFTRSDLVVGIGGGAVTDVAGFAAASWLRGIEWIAVPTTVAGAVDAAIGGKTGINTSHGKNLLGSFHSPSAVVVDLSWFDSLTDRDFAAGLAEVIKCGFIKDPSILELIEGKDLKSIRSQPILLEYLVRKAIAVKAAIVSRDFREGGEREILNYGHTLGHAIEQSSGYALRHGESVAIGMVFAAELAHAMGLINQDLVARHRRILSALDLPTKSSNISFDDLEPYLALDKKARGKVLRFVLLTDLGKTLRCEPSSDLRAIYERLIS